MTRKIRWGVLSTAGIGKRRVIPAMQLTTNGEVAAGARRNLGGARNFGGEGPLINLA